MRRFSIIALPLALLTFLAVFAADSAPNSLTDVERAAGWKRLFDGKTTNGWRNYQKPDIAAGWKVQNGELVRGEERAGDIITTEKYGAFELSLEYNISPGGNSGLMFHVTEESRLPWIRGRWIQIHDNSWMG